MSENKDSTEQAKSIISNAYDKLMSRQFFYYNIASQFATKAMQTDAEKAQCQTMGVAHIDGVHWLFYNPDFIKYYDYNEISVILEHEICHFTYDHVQHFDPSKNAKPIFKPDQEEEAKDWVRDQKKQQYLARLRNIATDRSINVHLFGLPNIRESIADVKKAFTDKEGNFNQQRYEDKMTEILAKGKQWFKDGRLNIKQYDPKPGASGEQVEQSNKTKAEAALAALQSAQDYDILESPCITETSFKDILKEADYQPTPELQQLRKDREDLIAKVKKEMSKDEPDQSMIARLENDIRDKQEEFSEAQDVELAKVQKYGGWEYYFDLLMSCPETEKAIQDIKEMDVHFGDDPGENGEGAEDSQKARDKVIMEAARNSNTHDIPGDLRQKIKEIFDRNSKEESLPWNVILRRLVNSSMKSIKKNDVNSRNKYAPGRQILPGYRLDPIKDICLIWDVSGSCMDRETQTRFIAEANKMIMSGSTLKVMYTDCGVEHEQTCDKGKPLKPNQYEVTGGGGTDMDPAIKKAISEGYKIIINLTDCYVPYRLTKGQLKGRKVITVSTTESKAPDHYGPTIHINKGK